MRRRKKCEWKRDEGCESEFERRTGRVEQQEETGEPGEPVRAVQLGGDGGDQREEAAAEEAVEDREHHLRAGDRDVSKYKGSEGSKRSQTKYEEVRIDQKGMIRYPEPGEE